MHVYFAHKGHLLTPWDKQFVQIALKDTRLKEMGPPVAPLAKEDSSRLAIQVICVSLAKKATIRMLLGRPNAMNARLVSSVTVPHVKKRHAQVIVFVQLEVQNQ